MTLLPIFCDEEKGYRVNHNLQNFRYTANFKIPGEKSIFYIPWGIHWGYMPSEDHKSQKKIQCWIPLETWDKIVSLGYTSPTIAVTNAFEKLLEDPREDPLTNTLVSPKNPPVSPEIPTGYKENIKALNNEIERLKNVIMNAPDPLELSRLQVRAEELEKHNQTLKEELEKAGRREDDLKAVHNNYMLQVQSLINQKAIEAPGNKKAWWKIW